MRANEMKHFHWVTPIGTVLFTWNSRDLITRVDWLPFYGRFIAEDSSFSESSLDLALPSWPQIKSYFLEGRPIQLLDGVLDQSFWTDFERRVYSAVLQIPHGETRTYAWVARKIGKPGATRAVGQALRRNRQLILIPCHRVVSTQDIGGYLGSIDPSAPEVQFKKQLLGWEDSWINPSFQFLTA